MNNVVRLESLKSQKTGHRSSVRYLKFVNQLPHRIHNVFTLLNRLYGVWQRNCLPGTFVSKTLAIETNLYGFLVEFQNFISQNGVNNVIEPPSTRQILLEDENITSQLYGCFCVNFLINSAQKHPHKEQHTLLLQKWLLSVYWLMYCSIIQTNNFRNTIFYGKVIAIENWFYLHEKSAIKRVIWLKLLTLVFFKHVFYNCKI